MELIVGSTGVVGGMVARRLAEEGRRVRGMVRGGRDRPEGAELERAGIEVVDGDLTRRDTLPSALKGAKTVICTATSMPEGKDDGLRRVDRDGVLSLLEVAEAAGVERFVHLSISGNIDIPCPLHDAKRACERKAADCSFRSVILRPSFFMEAWLGPALGFDPAGGKVRVYGTGEAPVSYVSAADVAEFAVATARARVDGDAVLEIGGPEAISQLDAVRIVEERLGREIEREHVPAEFFHGQVRSDDPLEQTFGALCLQYTRGDVIDGAVETAERFGITLRSVADYAAGMGADAG